MRHTNLNGVFDIHTNIIQYPKIMQPTHARWERLPPPDPRGAARLMQDMSSLTLTNGAPAENEEAPEPSTEPNATHHPDTITTDTTTATDTATEHQPTIFSSIPASLSNRFGIHDIHYESPQYSNMGIPGPDGDLVDVGPNGLITIANPQHPEFMTQEILAELPPECKEALLTAAANEYEWKSKWGTETEAGARSRPLKNYAWFP